MLFKMFPLPSTKNLCYYRSQRIRGYALYLLSKLEEPTTGDVFFENKNLKTSQTGKRLFARFNRHFQSYGLIPT